MKTHPPRGDDRCRCTHYRDGHTKAGRGDCAAPGCSCDAFAFMERTVTVVPGRVRKAGAGGGGRRHRVRVTATAEQAYAAYLERLGRAGG